jgi:hypothetical protein
MDTPAPPMDSPTEEMDTPALCCAVQARSSAAPPAHRKLQDRLMDTPAAFCDGLPRPMLAGPAGNGASKNSAGTFLQSLRILRRAIVTSIHTVGEPHERRWDVPEGYPNVTAVELAAQKRCRDGSGRYAIHSLDIEAAGAGFAMQHWPFILTTQWVPFFLCVFMMTPGA